MLRHSDDDLYNVHSRWLGPAGRTLPMSIPFKGIPVGAAAFTLAVVVLRAFGAGGLPMWAAVIVFTGAATKIVIAVTGPERPVRSLAALLAAEVSAPRPAPDRAQTAVLTLAATGFRALADGSGDSAGRRA